MRSFPSTLHHILVINLEAYRQQHILCLFKCDLSSLFLPFIYNFSSLILLFRHVNHFPSKTCKHLQPNFYLYSLQILFFLLVAKMCIITISEKHCALYASSDVLLKGSLWKSLLPFSFFTILFSGYILIEKELHLIG